MLQHGQGGSGVKETEETQQLSVQIELLREEMSGIARRLDALAMPLGADGPASMTGLLADGAFTPPTRSDFLRRPRPPLPDPRLLERIIRQRRLRERYFEKELFADPAWDILLDLAAARADHRRVSITSLCIAAAVPATTALRWISMMTRMGILVRSGDANDRRRTFIALSDGAADALARYFDELGQHAGRMV